jgi:hypothetical protein
VRQDRCDRRRALRRLRPRGATLQGSFALQQVDGTPLPNAQRTIVGIDNVVCDDGTGVTTSNVESGKAFQTADGWRLDFTGADLALSTHYYGRLDGTTLTIVRRETDAMSTEPCRHRPR